MLRRFLFAMLFVPVLLAAQVQVFNCGIGGHNSRNGIKRLDDLLKQYTPTVLVIGYGANDAVNSRAIVPLPEFKKNLTDMIAVARSRNVRIIVLNSCNPCVDRYLSSRHKYPDQLAPSERIIQYNKAAKEAAAECKVIFNDFHAEVMARGGATEKVGSLIRNVANSKSPDGLHLTSEGAKVLAETVLKALGNKITAKDRILCLGDSITYGATLIGAGTVTGQTYPAWLKTELNYNLGLSKDREPAPYVKPRPMQVRNGSFEDDNPGAVPLEWVNNNKSGNAAAVVENNNKFLRLTSDKISFCRTNDLIPQDGNWVLRLRARGKGTFTMSASMVGEKNNFVQLHKEWVPLENGWKEYEFPFSVPKKLKVFMLVIRSRGGVADFDDFRIEPAAGKKTVDAAAVLQTNNAELSVLHPSKGGGIASLVKDGKVQFINLSPRKSIWSITLKESDISNQERPEVLTLAIDPERDDNGTGKNTNDNSTDLNLSSADFANAEIEFKKDQRSIVMTWKNLNVGSEKGALDVQTEIKVSDDGKSFVFQGSFRNRSKKYTVFYFDYPAIGGIGRVNGDFSKDFLATPFFNGRLIRNPVQDGLLNKKRLYQPNRSGHSMHVDVFYNSGNGLYFGVHDPDQNAKRWDISADIKQGLSWFVRNIPNNMRQVPQNWKIPYPTLIRTFNGDWYDGCQIYRQWATAQLWCKEGKIHTRKSIPQWFKDNVEWGQFVANQFKNQDPMMRRFRKEFADYPLAVFLTYWGHDNKSFHTGDPDRFPLTENDKQVLASLKENNVSIMGYIQCIGWSDLSPSFLKDPQLAKRNLVRNYYGQFLKWPQHGKSQDLIAYPGDAWTKALGDNVVEMAKKGFRAAYLDSGNHGGTYLNFTPDCTKDSGGGDSYVKNQHKLLATLRKRAREINPEFCLTAESFWEGNIAHLDGYLVCNTTNAYLENDRVTAIPMIQTVYKDYALMHSVWPSRFDTERDNALGYVTKFGLAFCWGVTPGWNIFNLLYTYKNGDIAVKTSRERYAAYTAGKTYFTEGQLLRSPEISCKSEKLRVKWHRSYSANYFDILMDPVIGSVFQAPDGSYALVLYNISEKPENVSVSLKKTLSAGTYHSGVLYPAGQKFVQGSDRTFELEVPARVPVILTLTAQK